MAKRQSKPEPKKSAWAARKAAKQAAPVKKAPRKAPKPKPAPEPPPAPVLVRREIRRADPAIVDAFLSDVWPKTLQITIPGTPMGKPRMTQRDKWQKRPCVLRYRALADAARLIAGWMPPPTAVLRLDWVAYFEPAAGLKPEKREALLGQLHRFKPDRDNVDKFCLDTLFKSDEAIAAGTIEKRWGSPARLELLIVYEQF